MFVLFGKGGGGIGMGWGGGSLCIWFNIRFWVFVMWGLDSSGDFFDDRIINLYLE